MSHPPVFVSCTSEPQATTDIYEAAAWALTGIIICEHRGRVQRSERLAIAEHRAICVRGELKNWLIKSCPDIFTTGFEEHFDAHAEKILDRATRFFIENSDVPVMSMRLEGGGHLNLHRRDVAPLLR